MTASSSLDREFLQKLLSSAFVVQQSGIATESLAAVVELQESIATGEFDLDEAMDMIAERARNVANATGVAIGLLKGDRLAYRAGSGGAAKHVGRHAMATLCGSTQNTASEILRVENAQADARIEAAICRQFGAQALLILPIYHDRAVGGVLEVLFSEAHAFKPGEVRTYWLMAGLVEDALANAGQPEQGTTRAAVLSTMQQCFGQTRPQIENSLNDGGSASRLRTNHAIRQPCGDFFADRVKMPWVKRSEWTASKWAKRVPLYKRRWETSVTVALMMVLAFWIVYRDRRPTSPVGASAPQRSAPFDQEIPVVPVKRVLANSTSKPPTALGSNQDQRKAVRIMKRWVRVGNNELDYVTPDVTVRYFTPSSKPQRVLGRNHQVRHISEDVMLRYFAPQPPVAPPPVGSTTQVGR